MNGACRTHGRDENAYIFVGKPGGTGPMGGESVDVKIILEWIFER
jgi:hypothetical protein